jgi:hypothetical protein
MSKGLNSKTHRCIGELVGTLLAEIDGTRRTLSVTRKLCLFMLVLSMAFAVGCSKSNETVTSAGANSNSAAETATRPGPDNSQISTKVDANGVKTEERVFHNNPRISRVVVTTANGQRTVKAYSPSGEEREVNQSESEGVLDATGDKVADAAHFVADKSEDVAGKAKDVGSATKEKTEAIGEKTVDKSKTVGEKSADVGKTVGQKSAEGAKTVGEKSVEGAQTVKHKTVSGAKKVGSAVKKVIP